MISRSLAAATIFSRSSAPPRPLIKSSVPKAHLVGAVDGEIQALVLGEGRDRNPQPARLSGGAL